jgi:hypothetical protein
MAANDDPNSGFALSAAERDMVRREFGIIFGKPWPLADGIPLKVWGSGPKKGEAKLAQPIQSMVDRGLLEVRDGPFKAPSAYFTERGIEAVRRLLTAKRPQLDPERHGHLWAELGLTAPAAAGQAPPP